MVHPVSGGIKNTCLLVHPVSGGIKNTCLLVHPVSEGYKEDQWLGVEQGVKIERFS